MVIEPSDLTTLIPALVTGGVGGASAYAVLRVRIARLERDQEKLRATSERDGQRLASIEAKLDLILDALKVLRVRG